ncbi:MAG: MBL fold metallo-hydrolase [Smithellaceae bacterium]|jgi:L-ascorbate metabolism protein UlaG (beta-lactamase superfamily)|nr:MBL fold metallo-hydrolase [Smithellaceae bacterium]MDD3258872.1 MBL fold metallo-hydrolase [Smithellaceae bacterium]MDD3848994.1 MBL fold metallo-hydrolase [Smithellaceae bacterium]HOG12236.1 MBL fold metallo-hydrolase [Smithellaceae bacterium]HOQ72544.1 MBL fold metallo-hydrolase [Smithellaceae bacterium]
MESDTIQTPEGDLVIRFVGHSSLIFFWAGKNIHADPVSLEADYARLPKADVILITHGHGDHMDVNAVNIIKIPATKIVGNDEVGSQIPGTLVMKNGEERVVEGLKIEAVPAYNLKHMRAPGKPFHPKGVGNGYVVTLGGLRVYIAGDTENIPEMRRLQNIDIAFLPMNLPYTMTPEMAADAAQMFHPKVLYPYHQGETDTAKLLALMKDHKDIDVRIRTMK